MLMVTLLNSCFWVGIALLTARCFQDTLSRLLATVVVGFATVVISLELLSLAGAIRLVPVTWICGFSLVAGISIRSWPRTADRCSSPDPDGESSTAGVDRCHIPRIVSLLISGFAIWCALDCLLYGLFTAVLVDSDAPIYHLPFAIRWARAGTIEFVPTPFGEEGAPYFPANGDLWLTWLALTSQGAALVKIGQWPFLAIGGVALYAVGRQIKATREASAIAAGIWCCLPLTLRQASVANVDLIWTAFYFIAVFFVMKYRAEAGRCGRSRRDLWMAALSVGIVLGTKSVGLAYSFLLIGTMIWLIWFHSPSAGSDSMVGSPDRPVVRGDRRRSLSIRIQELGLLMSGIFLPGIYWFGRNFRMTGNPLYPLDFSWFHHQVLAGWYDTSAMRATAYHVPVFEWPVLVIRLWYTAGPFLATVWFVSVISGLLPTSQSIGKHANAQVRLLSLLALSHVGIYWFVVPYNTQERFLLPALGIGLIPLSRALTLWPSMAWPLGVTFLGHVWLALSGGGTAMDDGSFRTLRTLIQFGAGWRCMTIVGSLVVAGTMVLESRWVGRTVAAAAILISCFHYGSPLAHLASSDPERAFYPEGGFGARMLPAWRIVARVSRPTGARVAYAGGNLPYYLLGSSFRNEARYVNINRHRDWLPHDYHKARRLAGNSSRAAIPWPQWYREDADYGAWLDNLRAAEIDLLFVSRMNLHGRLVDLEGELPAFPIERVWADSHPEEFEDLGPHSTPAGSIAWARVYRLRERSEDSGGASE